MSTRVGRVVPGAWNSIHAGAHTEPPPRRDTHDGDSGWIIHPESDSADSPMSQIASSYSALSATREKIRS
jgi:hypothetical protein